VKVGNLPNPFLRGLPLNSVLQNSIRMRLSNMQGPYNELTDVREKIFYSIDFFKLRLWTDNDLLVSEMK